MSDNWLFFLPHFRLLLETTNMNKILFAGLAAIGLAGCVSDQQFLDSKQGAALDTALNRARFTMNCPGATGQVLSREVVQPVVNMPRAGGIERAQYTIGIAGCGQRLTTVVICAEGGEGCFATQ
jgi:hypothetical protein